MYKILDKNLLGPQTFELTIEAEDIAKKAKPGQFLIIRLDDSGERIPLTIADTNPAKGKVVIVIQIVGATSQKMAHLGEGDKILDVCGPLGEPHEMGDHKTVVLVGGGCGIAAVYPEAKAYHEKGGIKIIGIIGARSTQHLIWEDRMSEVCDELIIMTDDGSKGRKGLVTEALKEVIEREKVDEVIAIGPVPMMKFCSHTTYESEVKTTVSLNPIMIDGIGMCGACRVIIDGETKFACVDGPEFNGHLVDWDDLINRNSNFTEEELKEHKHHGGGNCGCQNAKP